MVAGMRRAAKGGVDAPPEGPEVLLHGPWTDDDNRWQVVAGEEGTTLQWEWDREEGGKKWDDQEDDEQNFNVVLRELARLAARVKELEAGEICDGCLGKGVALSGPCGCGGTGRMSDMVASLRVAALVDLPSQIAELEAEACDLRRTLDAHAHREKTDDVVTVELEAERDRLRVLVARMRVHLVPLAAEAVGSWFNHAEKRAHMAAGLLASSPDTVVRLVPAAGIDLRGRDVAPAIRVLAESEKVAAEYRGPALEAAERHEQALREAHADGVELGMRRWEEERKPGVEAASREEGRREGLAFAANVARHGGTMGEEMEIECAVADASRPERGARKDRFLVASTDRGGGTIDVEHPAGAPWEEVYRAMVALRNHLSDRIKRQEECPVRHPRPEGGA